MRDARLSINLQERQASLMTRRKTWRKNLTLVQAESDKKRELKTKGEPSGRAYDMIT
jgi:hypothetical protein